MRPHFPPGVRGRAPHGRLTNNPAPVRRGINATRFGARGKEVGTDIHGVFQRHDGAAWVDIPSKYEESRHYQLFAVLAGVRNGTGFAGIRTGEKVTPISEPRGLPDDFNVVDGDTHPIETLQIISERRRKYREPDDAMEVWMGDHSHSWLTADEMLAWFETAPAVVQTGIISREQYDAWDKQSTPDSYCGGISGPSVIVIEEPEVGRTEQPWTHVRVTWESGLKDELKYFFNEVRRLHEEHGQVRYVFGFDS